MPREDHAGCFHASRTMNGRTEVQRAWRVTAGTRHVASVIARRLGGEVYEVGNSLNDEWEVLTESSAVEILVNDISGNGITFTLPGEVEVGEFSFSSEMWNPVEISRIPVGSPESVRCGMALKAVEFTTRTGLTFLYILPSIEILTSGV
ncbi:hypothetical protein ACFWOB_21865 [Streptomyces sp. NPDC058420]|uniref:hypothetical protein n=1 Tax=Streptomyces sp. NPDC058420 TaxID=3346489 RepID=UPI00364E7A32